MREQRNRCYHAIEFGCDGGVADICYCRQQEDASTARSTAKLLGFIAVLASCLVVGFCSTPAYADEFKPLTRAEPIVRMVLQESVSEPLAGQVAVAGVALDRMTDPRWPGTAREVVYQPWQFTGMHARLGKYNRKEIEIARLAVKLARSGTRPCGTVLWYHTTEVDPSWNKRLQVSCQIGDHIFYGDRDADGDFVEPRFDTPLVDVSENPG